MYAVKYMPSYFREDSDGVYGYGTPEGTVICLKKQLSYNV